MTQTLEQIAEYAAKTCYQSGITATKSIILSALQQAQDEKQEERNFLESEVKRLILDRDEARSEATEAHRIEEKAWRESERAISELTQAKAEVEYWIKNHKGQAEARVEEAKERDQLKAEAERLTIKLNRLTCDNDNLQGLVKRLTKEFQYKEQVIEKLQARLK